MRNIYSFLPVLLLISLTACNNSIKGNITASTPLPSIDALVFTRANVNDTLLDPKVVITSSTLPGGEVEVVFEMLEYIYKNRVQISIPEGATLECEDLVANVGVQRFEITEEKMFQIQPVYWVADENDWIARENQEFRCHYELAGQTSNDIVFKIRLKENPLVMISAPLFTGVEEQTVGGVSNQTISANGKFIVYTVTADLFNFDSNGVGDIYFYDVSTEKTELISKSTAGVSANQSSNLARVSGDGRYVVFQSIANNLVTGDTNGDQDIFLRDRLNSTTERISVSTSGVEGNNNSYGPSISDDGRYVSFYSSSSNLVAGDTNGNDDIFVRDRLTGTTTRISLGLAGAEIDDHAYDPSISWDGRYIAYSSSATNIVAADTNGQDDIFLHDRQTGTTTRVSVSSAGVEADDYSYAPIVSKDGRFIAFNSAATNLIAGDTNSTGDVFLHDRNTATTVRVSVGDGGVESNAASFISTMSADGRYIGFTNSSSSLVPGDTNGVVDIFRYDTQTMTITRVSRNSSGVEANSASYFGSVSEDGHLVSFVSDATNLTANDGNSSADLFLINTATNKIRRISPPLYSSRPSSHSGFASIQQLNSISADGRFVVFFSLANNLVPGDSNGVADVFVHDRTTGAHERVSVSTAGVQGNAVSNDASISADGRYVAFKSAASNLVAGDSNGQTDIFVRDRVAQTTIRVSVATGGVQASAGSESPSISGNGRFVSFASTATNLVAGDTNGAQDIFVHDIQTATTTRVSVDVGGVEANGNSAYPSISHDGRFVAYLSNGSNIVVGDTNADFDIFAYDRQTGTPTRVNVSTGGVESNGNTFNPLISSNGRYVVFGSQATNLVAGDTNGWHDVFVRDLQLNTTVRVSVGTGGVQGNFFALEGSISDDGRYVVFSTTGSNFAANDTNGSLDVYLHDLLTQTTTLLSQNSLGEPGTDNSNRCIISSDGRYVTFRSSAQNLTPQDSGTLDDIFVVKRP